MTYHAGFPTQEDLLARNCGPFNLRAILHNSAQYKNSYAQSGKVAQNSAHWNETLEYIVLIRESPFQENIN